MSSPAVDNNKVKCDLTARYDRAAALEDGVFDKSVAYNTTLYPHWIGNTASFWYRQETRTGHCFRLSDAQSTSNVMAFDHQALANALSKATDEIVSADELPLSSLVFTEDFNSIEFTAFTKHWRYNLGHHQCDCIDSLPDQWVVSPDGKKAAFVRDHNIWLRDIASGSEDALTHDGERYRDYALSQPLLSHGFHQPSVAVEAIWSPDSTRLFTILIDIRDLEVGPPLVQYVPTDGSLRPKVLRPDRRVAFSGDDKIAAYQLLCIDVTSRKILPANYRQCPLMYPPYVGYFSGHRGWWDADSRHAYFIDVERGCSALHLVKLDTYTGETSVLITESSDVAVTLIPVSHITTLVMPLPSSDELIWYSERSGWAHFYLYELSTGKLKRAITEGDWLVRNILHLDSERRELWIQTAGRKAGRNPYYCDIVRINMDSSELFTIVATDHDYVVCDQRSRISASDMSAIGVSPCGNYVATTRSRVDQVPVSLLYDRDGQEIVTVETASVDGLPANWQWPEPIMLKAADNKTDIMAVVFRPSDFDPSQSYPILDHSYGYVSPVGSFSNSHMGSQQYLSPAACAELGFIVVVIHNRGKDGLRDVAFNNFEDPDFPEQPRFSSSAPQVDCVAGIKQLARLYPYMDINRVGVMETGSMPTALIGLLVHGDLYKVGVSNVACANSHMLAAQGRLPIGEEYPKLEDQVAKLRGKLLVISGMLEWAMPVAMTFRLIQALQQANKRFDMVLVPNLAHGRSSYTIQRSWDYLVEHLLGLTPPEDYQLDVSRGRMMDEEIKRLEEDYEG